MKADLVWLGGALLAFVFALTVSFERVLIPRLRARAAQPILEIGPSWHLSKAGTPTLGGLGFIFACLLAFLLGLPFFVKYDFFLWGKPLFLLLFSLGFALIGFFDDWRKLCKKQNKGLSAWQKYLLQLLLAILFLCAADRLFALSHTVTLPFSSKVIDLGILYYPLAVLYLTGIVNALNLTDGVDGLLSSLVGVFSAFLLLMGLRLGDGGSFLTACLLLGAVLGFLCFNAHPAKIFMGDTGSLFLGGMVGGYGLLSSSPLCVLLACGVFLLETACVILQVGYFKLSHGKRLFRMAPLHHHFEKGGWSEMRVVGVFCAIAAFFAALAFVAWRV